tara:strand:- start:114 stop:296 length:183 start_codon:yes stop_codon:yes gene_type:complete
LEAAWIGFELLGAIADAVTAGRLIESRKLRGAVKGQHHPNYRLKRERERERERENFENAD